MNKKYQVNTSFIRKNGSYLYVLSEPLFKNGIHHPIRIDSVPMSFVDMVKYIDKVIETTREHNGINVSIEYIKTNETCLSCGAVGIEGRITLYDEKDNSTGYTKILCDRCLLNSYFLFKMISTIEIYQ